MTLCGLLYCKHTKQCELGSFFVSNSWCVLHRRRSAVSVCEQIIISASTYFAIFSSFCNLFFYLQGCNGFIALLRYYFESLAYSSGNHKLY